MVELRRHEGGIQTGRYRRGGGRGAASPGFLGGEGAERVVDAEQASVVANKHGLVGVSVIAGVEQDLMVVGVDVIQIAPVCPAIIGAEEIDAASPDPVGIHGVHRDDVVVVALAVVGFAGRAECGAKQGGVQGRTVRVGDPSNPASDVTICGGAKYRQQAAVVSGCPALAGGQRIDCRGL